MQGSITPVQSSITNPVETAQQRLEAARSSKGVPARAPAPRPMQAIVSGIGVVDVDGIDRAFAQRCDAPRSSKAPEPTGTGPGIVVEELIERAFGPEPSTVRARTPGPAPMEKLSRAKPGYDPDPSDTSGLCRNPQEEKPLSMKEAEAAAIAAIATTRNVREAVSIALANAMTRKAKAPAPGWEDHNQFVRGEYQPLDHNQKCLWLVKFIGHHPYFRPTIGDGAAFTDRLIEAGVMEHVCGMLECDEVDLDLAATHVRMLAGQSPLDMAAARMRDVVLPAHIGAKVKGYPIQTAIVRLLAALAQQRCSTDVYLSHAEAARLLRKPKNTIGNAMKRLIEKGIVELLEKGTRKHPNAKGKASEYGLAWIVRG
jgi:hypothetical protein